MVILVLILVMIVIINVHYALEVAKKIVQLAKIMVEHLTIYNTPQQSV